MGIDRRSPPADPSLIRRVNSRTTIDALRAEDTMTLAQLVRASGLSRTALEGALHDLIERGLAAEVAPGVSPRDRAGDGTTATSNGRGRPARRFRFRHEARYIAAVGVDRVQIHVRVCDLRGHVVASTEIAGTVDDIADPALTVICRVIRRCLKEADVPERLLGAVGVGLPGVVDPDGRILRCRTIPSWENTDLARQLTREFGCPAFVDNDGRFAALGEQWGGVANGAVDVIFIVTGLRLGVGIMIDGSLHGGRHGSAGQIGYLRQLGWTREPPQLDTLRALYPGLPDEHAAVRAAEDAAAGSAAAIDLVSDYATGLAPGLAALVLAIDPELVVIGGTMAAAGPHFMGPLRTAVEQLVMFVPVFKQSRLGDEAMMMGATRRALNHIDERLLDLTAD
jgi:predicted NBD/HSP70 family sugar kinase